MVRSGCFVQDRINTDAAMMRAALFLLLLTAAACARHEFSIEAPASPPPVATRPQLHAGFARTDMTPPPGGGLMGYATEGRKSQGHRMRLYARALVLEDEGGERVALVLADLGSVSPLLHRLTARRTAETTGIGADRLILIASHTHSAPGHYYATPAYDEQASRVQGFDSAHATFVANRIAESINTAAASMKPARAVWGFTNVWGLTRVRDYAMTERNPSRFVHPSAVDARIPTDPRYRFIDPQMSILRVDTRNENGAYEPAGSFITFAIHGTLNPGANQLIDGDIHAIVARELEMRTGRAVAAPGVVPQTIHLFANGAQGDITAAVSDLTRCPPPTYAHPFTATGPRTPPLGADSLPVDFPPYPDCLMLSRSEALRVGNALADAAMKLHQDLDASIAHDSAQHMRIARVFDVVDIEADLDALCAPHAGPNTIPGPEGSRTRLFNIAFLRSALGMDTLPEARAGASREEDCQGVKPDLGTFEFLVGGRKPYPLQLQFSVLRLGNVTIGTVPAEPTTNAGWLMRRAMAGADSSDILRRFLILSLTNGYAQYVTTEAEYGAQMYAGASTIYGPRSAQAFATQLRVMREQLPAPGGRSPAASIEDVRGVYRSNREIVPRPSRTPQPLPVRVPDTCFRGDTLVTTWIDERPGDLVPADGPLARVDRRTSSGSAIVTWDDDPFLEVWYLGMKRNGHTWQARYAPARAMAGFYRIVLLARGELREVAGTWQEWGEAACS